VSRFTKIQFDNRLERGHYKTRRKCHVKRANKIQIYDKKPAHNFGEKELLGLPRPAKADETAPSLQRIACSND